MIFSKLKFTSDENITQNTIDRIKLTDYHRIAYLQQCQLLVKNEKVTFPQSENTNIKLINQESRNAYKTRISVTHQ